MRREIITWSVAVAVVIGGFVATVLVLNATLYSAGGFVRGYLDAIARQDATGALELAGPINGVDASRQLLTADAMGELTDIRQVSDTAGADGVHSVVVAWSAAGVEGTSTFEVRRQGTLLGMFPTWAFAESPFGIAQVTVANGTAFTANGVDLMAPAQDVPIPYLVFTPGNYELSHDSKYLSAPRQSVTVSTPGAGVIAPVEVGPTPALINQVQREIDDYLDECATQEVLLPAGCPFGLEMGNRIVSTPQWEISAYPVVALQPGPQPASWLVLPSTGTARVTVDVRSIFDGTVSGLDELVDFTNTYVVTFLGGDDLLISAQN